jgi:hypothetical protein
MNVENRQKLERNIVETIIQDAIKAGYLITIDNGGDDFEFPPTNDFNVLSKAIMATDDEFIYLFTPENASKYSYSNYFAWVFVVYGNDGWDVVCDYTTNLDRTDILSNANKLADSYC